MIWKSKPTTKTEQVQLQTDIIIITITITIVIVIIRGRLKYYVRSRTKDWRAGGARSLQAVILNLPPPKRIKTWTKNKYFFVSISYSAERGTEHEKAKDSSSLADTWTSLLTDSKDPSQFLSRLAPRKDFTLSITLYFFVLTHSFSGPSKTTFCLSDLNDFFTTCHLKRVPFPSYYWHIRMLKLHPHCGSHTLLMSVCQSELFP